MGVGRRNFLKITSTALAGLAINPLQAVVTQNNFYVNKILGLSFYRPQDWYFINVKDFGELKEKTVLSDEWEEFKDIVWESTGEPICLIAKYDQNNPMNHGKYSPSIAVWAEKKSDYEEMDIHTVEDYANSWTLNRIQYIQDPNVIKSEDVKVISGMKSVQYDCDFIAEHQDLPNSYRALCRMIYVEHGDYFYCFDLTDSIEAGETSVSEFKLFTEKINMI